ncbi:MAG: hypothetical protein ABI361_06960 [Nitrososphaera sp.]|jgi:hypothetical protein
MDKPGRLYLVVFDVTNADNEYYLKRVVRANTIESAEEVAIDYARHFWSDKPAKQDGEFAFLSHDDSERISIGSIPQITSKQLERELLISKR